MKQKKGFERVEETFIAILETFIAILLLIILVITFFQVLSRYIFSFYFSWGPEVSRYLLIWLTFFGAIIVKIKHKHFKIDIKLQSYLDNKFEKFVDVIISVVIILVLATLTYHFIFYLIKLRNYKYCSTSLLWLKMWIVFIPIPISTAFIAYYYIKDVLISFKKSKQLNNCNK